MPKNKIAVAVGGVIVGGESPVSIQSMLKFPLGSYDSRHLGYLRNMGCDIMRFSLFDETADQLKQFVQNSPLPLVCDIQGSLAQARMALESGCAAIRINPGNFSRQKLAFVADMLRDSDAAVRIGINEASINGRDIIGSVGEYIDFFEKRNVDKIVISVKSSDARKTLEYNCLLDERFRYPLHIGLTEAGFGVLSAVRSTIVLQKLLDRHIGNTVRYSVSGPEEDEIRCARELLCENGLLPYKFRLVACPMCSRHGVDTQWLSVELGRAVFEKFDVRKLNLTLAVMGCPVNGPGEAANADIAVCSSRNAADIYMHGEKILHSVPLDSVREELLAAIENHIGRRG